MAKPKTTQPAHDQKQYQRFSLDQRIEHILFLVSFSILGFTGLIQKFHESPFSVAMIALLGGIEITRIIHRTNAVIMLIVSGYHVIALGYRMFVLRVPWTMLPGIEDARHILQDIAYYLGFRRKRAYYGRYNYGEKMEYLAVVWGTIVMAVTGFMMWNPINTANLLPGQYIPAAKAAHGGEAVLAVLAIILWHFYNVHIRSFNKSMFTGKLNHEEMEEEHPAELALIESGKQAALPTPQVLRKRQQIFFPVAIVMAGVFSFGIWRFITLEPNTAITTLPQGETAAIFVPITPTPRPTLTPTPTPDPNKPVGPDTWDGNYAGLFRDRCSTCHYTTAVGGLKLDSYADALAGGKSGPAIIPNDPDQSMIVKIQSQGGHPGQLTADELEKVINWIKAGAPEK